MIKTLRYFAFSALFVLGCLVLFNKLTGHTAAVSVPTPAILSQVSPEPNDSNPTGAHVFLMRSNSNRGQNLKLNVNAYYPSGISNWGQQYIEINNPGGSCDRDNGQGSLCAACDTYAGGMSNYDLNRFVEVDINEDSYFISIANVCRSKATRNATCLDTNITNCQSDVLFARYGLPSKALSFDSDTGLYKVSIRIKYNPNISTPNTSNGNNDMTIKIVGMDASTSSQTAGLKIGPNGTGSGSYNFPLIGKSAYNGQDTSVGVPFGLPCSETTKVFDQKVAIYDADNFGAFLLNVQFQVYDITNNQPHPFHGGFDGTRVDNSGNPDPNGEWYRPNAGNTTKAYFLINMDASLTQHFRYELRVKFIDGGNTIVVSLPQDTIYGAINCPPNPLPSVSCVLNAPPISTGDKETVTVNGAQHNYPSPPASLQLKLTSIHNDSTGTNVATPAAVNVAQPYNYPFPLSGLSAGVYSVSAKVTDTTLSISNTCDGNFTVAFDPYLAIYGGDAAAGVSPQYDGTNFSAYINNSASFVGWNNGSGPWGSAGAQWAVQALGSIDGFPSGRGVGSTATVPWYLSFANTSQPADYGGQFGGTSNVTIDYSKYISQATTTYAVNKAIGPVGVANGTHQTVVVKNHDAFIQGPIQYSSTAWSTTADIPSYKLIVVGGDIYIGSGVNELDGTYVSLYDPSTGKGGNVYTCASNILGIYLRVDPNDPGYYSACKTSQLKVFGALVAKKVYFDRTYGSFTPNQNELWSGSQAAESIIYSPELWLSSGTGTPGNYSAITGLPPIL